MAAPIDPRTAGAAAVLNAQLAAWGITGLGPDVLKFLRQGLDANALMLQLEQTDAYKKRFIANEARKKAGLRVLPPAEYVATETTLKSLGRQYGISPNQFNVTKMLERDVSPAEAQDRLNLVQQRWLQAPPEERAAWKSFYGATDGDALTAILNPDHALSLVQRQAAAAQLGGIAGQQHLGVDRSRAESLVSSGVSAEQAQQGFGQIAESLSTDQAIAQRFGSQISQTDEEDARLLGLASARRKLRTLQASEASLFAGGGSAGGGALSGSGAGSY